MAARQHLNIDLDAEVASILRSHAAEAHVSEGEIVDRAIRAYDLRSLVARVRERSDLDEDAAVAPNFTAVVPVRCVPVIFTDVAPPVGPEAGLIDVIVGPDV